MINPKDFRLGNLIQDREGRICKITKLQNEFEDETQIQAWPIKGGGLVSLPFEPIQVTKELLLKSGFDQEELIYNFWQFSIKPYYGTFDWVIFWKGHAILYVKDLYFHRLQNLIFDLSGKELTL